MKIAALAFKAFSVLVLVISMNSILQAQEPAPPPPPPPPPAPRQGDSVEVPKIIRKSGGVLQNTATKRVTPEYPQLALEARVSGSVVVEITVTEEGTVMSARAISGHPLLRDAAVDAARGWEFTPTQLSGVPVKVIGTITFNFTPTRDPALVKEAEDLMQQLRDNQGSSDLYIKLGDVLNKLGDYKDAAASFKRALQFEEKSVPARVGLVRAYFWAGYKEAAMAEHAKLKELDPDAAESVLKEIQK
ncbi:MAG TPA: TonB family protein [Blastocatellia bacterium]|nr:TonB family protein [Blastocatellia bacterium]